MKLTLHEVAKVVGAKNTISEFDDVPCDKLNLTVVRLKKGIYFYH